jgi:CRP-like cAMP-binding protein
MHHPSELLASGTSPRANATSHDAHATERNRLLRALPSDAYARLAPFMEPVELATGRVLWRADGPIEAVYFPRTAVCSLLTPLSDEAPVESATVGCEGMVGVPLVLGAASTHTLAIAQVAGSAIRVDAVRFREWLATERHPASSVFFLYAQALIEQTAQSVACNRRHAMEERCARWLLATADRVDADRFHLTHEFLAAMLGVRRASVTVAAGMLQRAGIIRYTRGRITVLDRALLEEASCECYRVVHDHYERLLSEPSGAV